MLVYLALDPQQSLASVPAYARRAERLGFDGLHVPETIHDSLAVALLALEHTTRLTVRTAVTLAFVRSPTAVAYAAWDLSVLSGGRFELGLGSQIKQNIRDRFAMEWTEPVERMRDYVGALQALFEAFRTGGSLNFEGAHYRLTRMQPYFNPGPSDALPPPIWLGAVNAGMSELAGEVAHGVVTHSTNSEPEHLRDVVRPALQRGAIASGRSAPAVVIASPAVATGVDDAAVAVEREHHRRMLAFLYSTPAYAPALIKRGLTDLPERLRELVRAQQWDRLPAVVTDAVVDEFVVCARYDELPQLLAARFGPVADGVVLPPLRNDAGDAAIQACVAALAAH
ncbi:LLM class F420-dependent oxidoreductase [Mycolicibacterium cyprinidarum]|uniref:LLM class F420-dependent oxidoreductase n=1 Tax=Mycolicibacterium cyprinidarum TaxID=2860311 RepID=A0ABQ4VBA1_9MYCO|nr:LLM class F420-dependent oxidoreductase [Mycolicibacterium sp. NGTWSNA01]GJF15363.1 LLM class F420-dependent oxidoreductase [Mycolicibacterium sp. NGTWS0302]GJF15577.1 LLM class F420-dependent oxidoreductase [Mycolicibacterium sp. NGTWS1803]